MKTWKNKLSAVVLLACGYAGVLIENDGTALVFFAMFAIPLILCQRELGVLKDRAANNGSFFFAPKLQLLLWKSM